MYKEYNKIAIKFFLCFVVLISLYMGSNQSYALKFNWETDGYLSFSETAMQTSAETSSGRIEVYKQDNTSTYLVSVQITGTSSDADVYTVTVRNEYGTEVEYLLKMSDNTIVPLASSLIEGSNPPQYELKQNISSQSTSVIVPLRGIEEYSFIIDSEIFDNSKKITIEVTRMTSISGVYQSNVPSSVISMHVPASNPLLSVGVIPGVQQGNLTEEQMKAIEEQIKGEEELKAEKGSWIEGILADLILKFGQIIQWLSEIAFGLSGDKPLTLDNLVFNKMDAVVIDLRDIFSGGIQVGPSERRGYLTNQEVVQGIQGVYTGLRGLAITVYLVLLLYVGVRILLGIGTPNEAKVKKYVQYWVTGIVLLFFVPYFLSLIPTINNALVRALSDGGKVKPYSTYTITQIAEELGQEYLGEDAEIPAMQRELTKRISDLHGRLGSGETLHTSEAEEKLEAYIRINIERNINYSSDDKNILKDKINDLKNYVLNNALSWTQQNSDYIRQESKQFATQRCQNAESSWERLYMGVGGTEGFNLLIINTGGDPRTHPLAFLPDSEKTDIKNAYQDVVHYLVTTRANIKATDYNAKKENVINKVKNSSATDEYKNLAITSIRGRLDGLKNFMVRVEEDYANKVYDALEVYRRALIGDKIETYEGMLEALSADPMVLLEKMAKENSRVVYAIAWVILLFQTFAVLFMYIKRLVVTMILICLFPIVMAVYVLDKIGDGRSQSLQTWFKEFIANTTVQFFHAVVYILLINLALDIVRKDPERNWFILIIATCSLFPVERIMRDILGVQSSTLGSLKLSIGALIGAGFALGKMGAGAAHLGAGAAKGIGNAGKSVADNFRANMAAGAKGGVFGAGGKALGQSLGQGLKGAGQSVKGHFSKNYLNAVGESNDKRKKKQEYRDSRSQNRRELAARRASIKENGIHSVGDVVTTARAGVAKVTGAASNLAGKVRNSFVGRGALKIGQTARFAGKELKFAGGYLKKAAAIGIGLSQGVDAVANGGLAAGITSATSTAASLGGFKPPQKGKKEPVDSSKSPFNPQYGPISNPTGAGISGRSGVSGSRALGDSSAEPPPSGDFGYGLGGSEPAEEMATPTITPESLAGAALAGAAINALSTPGHEQVDTPEETEGEQQANEQAQADAQATAEEDPSIKNDVKAEAVDKGDTVEVTQDSVTEGNGIPPEIADQTFSVETNLIENGDGSIGLNTGSTIEMVDETRDVQTTENNLETSSNGENVEDSTTKTDEK